MWGLSVTTCRGMLCGELGRCGPWQKGRGTCSRMVGEQHADVHAATLGQAAVAGRIKARRRTCADSLCGFGFRKTGCLSMSLHGLGTTLRQPREGKRDLWTWHRWPHMPWSRQTAGSGALAIGQCPARLHAIPGMRLAEQGPELGAPWAYRSALV